MPWLVRFLVNLFIRAPQELVVALLRIVLMVLLLLLVLLLRFWEWLLELLRSKNLREEERKRPCGRLPEAIIRRPDPCIYSQRLLMSQGLSVTWNNPDIWMAPASDPAGVLPDSYHLTEDTDYIVTVQVHNASATDPAIGVRVRLNYRPWSFNSPDLVPVQTDGSGHEVFRFADVPPMGADEVTFLWHTPKLDPGEQSKHYCLQASLHHPMDTNPSNNMGQENTNVHAANPEPVAPGQTVNMAVPLFNLATETQLFRFEANAYEIDSKAQYELRLRTTHGHARRSLAQRLANAMPRLRVKTDTISSKGTHVDPRAGAEGRLGLEAQPSVLLTKARYVGFEAIRADMLAKAVALPDGMTVTANGDDLNAGVPVEAKETREVGFAIRIPPDAAPGSRLPVNLVALGEDGVLAGGVTVLLDVQGGD